MENPDTLLVKVLYNMIDHLFTSENDLYNIY